MHPRLRKLLLATTPLLAFGLTQASAGPEGASVVGGAATISGQGGPAVIVNQSTSSAVINWNTFNIRANESVRFNQPSASSVALNRVVGGLGPSEIMGSLTANGRVFIINRDGILFGPGSVVNTAGFLATTNDIKNADFMAGRYNFNIPGRPDASIVNQGRITATSGGFAALVAPGVRNSGTITATLGTVALASGNSFTLDMYGDKLITLAVGDSIANKVIDVATGRPLKSLVSNTKSGTLSANGGRVELTAAAARAVVDSVINTKGVIRADSIGRHNGMIVLNAATGGSKPAGAPAQTIKLAGTISAAGKHRGTTGGTIVVSGEHIKVANAKIDASGRRGGGKILIGGDWGGGHPDLSLITNASAKLENFTVATATTVSVDANSTINASATGRGNGGKVVLWSDNQTTFAGTILAKGGAKSGDGGFVETSSHGQLAFTGNVDAGAPRGAAGTLLLDPSDFYIVPDCLGSCAPSTMTGTQISNLLATQNLIIATNDTNRPLQHGDIFVFPLTNITWGSGWSLTLSAHRDINIIGGAVIKSTGAGNLVLRADSGGTGTGTVNLLPLARVDFSKSTGTVSIYYNPRGEADKYRHATNFSCSGLCLSGGVLTQQPSQLAAYMLVSSADDLKLMQQNVSTNVTGSYALGKSFSAAGFAGFAPGTTFSGLFDGNGGISAANYTIRDLAVALFPVIGNGARVRNLNLAEVNVQTAGISLGALAGENRGTISNVHVLSGTVGGASRTGISAGGLIGLNYGLIQQSGSAANVSGGALSSVGGLVGQNFTGSTIKNSYAMGNVTGGDSAFAGGLAALNAAGTTIESSYATGSVTAGGLVSAAGGLVGENLGSIAASHATGLVTVGDGGWAGGLAGQNLGGIATSYATGVITVGDGGWAGGLAGQNFANAAITASHAEGNVIAGNSAVAGGLVGSNGTGPGIANSYATGSVVAGSMAASAGGLAGHNLGVIATSHSTGIVTVGNAGWAGGLVGSNGAGSEIGNSYATGSVAAGSMASAGGLAGQNLGVIATSHATGIVTVGNAGWAGGLVGSNGAGFEIENSYATGTVTGAAGAGGITTLGGLAGTNQGLISGSWASGNVGSPLIANLQAGGLAGSNSGTIQSSSALGNVQAGDSGIAGGLVATNLGTITDSSATGATVSGGTLSLAGGLVGTNPGTIAGSSASGAVNVGSNGTAGGLVAFNTGSITNALATGTVTGAAGAGGITTLGGLAGTNQGRISGASASGNVGIPLIANLQAGGLVGSNFGTIQSSVALGGVQTGDASTAGGLVATNTVCSNCVNGLALIQNSSASGNVGVGAASVAGGLVGSGNGTILSSAAEGSVTGGGNSVLGGFIGTLTFENGPAQIASSSASGAVTSTGSNSTVGGFAGLTSGTILTSSASGPVTGTSDSYLGGFVGVNLGSIEQSFTAATASVTGTGNRDVIGGFVGANFGSIDASSAAGNATGTTDSAVGAFAGENATFVNFSVGAIPNSSFPDGTITNSSATGTASGGTGSTVDPFIALVNPTTAANPPAFPSIIFGCTDPTCVFVSTGLLPSPLTSQPTSQLTSLPLGSPTSPLLLLLPEFLASLSAQQAQVTQNLAGTVQLAALSTPPVVSNVQGAIQLPPQPAAPPPGAGGGQQPPAGIPARVIDIPPPNETRFIQDEVILQIAGNITVEQLQAAVAQLGLTLLASQNLAITGSTAVQFRITDGRTPAEIIRALAAIQLVAVAQPNYVYSLEQAAPADQAPASRGNTGQQGDAAQYILEKLKMLDVHRMVRGANITIAVIDSEIDVTHPDLAGVVAQRFSAVGGAPEKPHAHGTGMAGAMAARQRILGTAPGARLLAVHAFSTNAATAESTTFNILKGIDWSVSQGARIINMSFAGPKDPSLQRALKLAYDKGIVLVAAAGNAGAKSPPLFPGADPLVIAVTATDVDDKLFTGANRGYYISVAAPGVDILVPAPDNAYQLTTGTSVAAAEVSGIVALLLERNPKLTPADIRRILTASARRLGPGERDDNFGAGLIDPLKALQLADPRTATPGPTTLRQR